MRGRYYHYGLGALSTGDLNKETPESHEAQCAKVQKLAEDAKQKEKESKELKRAKALNRGKKGNTDKHFGTDDGKGCCIPGIDDY
jgi:hypothetical protein